jgi:ubiquitin-protein ligase
MLDTPNADDPANGDAARMFKNHKNQYSRRVKEYAATVVPDI